MAVTAAMAALSDGNLFFSQIPATKKVLADAEKNLSSKLEGEDLSDPVPILTWHKSKKSCAYIGHRRLWYLGNVLMHSAYIFTPFNMPAGIRDLSIVFCRMGVKASKHGNCNIIASNAYYYNNLVIGTLLGLPAAVTLKLYRLRDAQSQYDAFLDTIFYNHPSPLSLADEKGSLSDEP